MSGTSPNYEYWRQFSTLCCWELAVLIEGFDPRALADVVVANDEPLDYSETLRIVTSAVEAGELGRVENNEHSVGGNTKIDRRDACLWAGQRGYRAVATGLCRTHEIGNTESINSGRLENSRDDEAIPPLPGSKPKIAIRILMVNVAWEIEQDTNRRASAKEVLNELARRADAGKHPETLVSYDEEKRAVIWTTQGGKHKPFDIDACSKGLADWNKTRR